MPHDGSHPNDPDLAGWSAQQPEGLFDVGSWDGATDLAEVTAAPEALAEAAAAFLDGRDPEEPHLTREQSALVVFGWLPVVLDLDGTYLVRQDDGPTDVRKAVTDALQRRGWQEVTVEVALLESITMQRLGLIQAAWQAWAVDEAAAAHAVAAACAG